MKSNGSKVLPRAPRNIPLLTSTSTSTCWCVMRAKCDWICGNLACRQNAQVAQCAFLSPVLSYPYQRTFLLTIAVAYGG